MSVPNVPKRSFGRFPLVSANGGFQSTDILALQRGASGVPGSQYLQYTLQQLADYIGTGGAAWGAITGTLSNQTDLQAALNLKADASSLSAYLLSSTAASTYATIASVAGKEPIITAGTTAQYWRGDKTFQTLDKAAVGLGNVDNTSDANKPVSTETQTALDGKVNLAGAAGGQTVNGGTDASQTLTLSSTTNATKGKVLFGTSAYDEVNNRLGVGTNAPAEKVEVFGTDPLIRISTDSTSTAIAGIEMFRNSVNRSRIIQDGFGVNTRFIQYGVPSVPNPLYGAFQWQTSPVTSGTLVTQMTLLGGGNLGVGGITAPTASIHTGASTTARASICLPHGAAPTTPVNGDMWTTTAGLFGRINGATVGYTVGAASSTDRQIPLWSGATGKILQSGSAITVGATGQVSLGGGAVDTNIALQCAVNVNNPAAAAAGANFQRGISLTAANAQTVTGGQFIAAPLGSAFNYNGMYRGGYFAASGGAGAGNTLADMRAGHGLVYLTTASTLTDGYGFKSDFQNLNASGIITNSYGFHSSVVFNNGTMTNTYGYYCADVTAGTQTNQAYSFYAVDDNACNFFAGNTGFGTSNSAPTAVVDLAASTTARASLRMRNGVAPTTPNNGDIWFDGTDLKLRTGGVTKTFALI